MVESAPLDIRELRLALDKARGNSGDEVLLTGGWQKVDGLLGKTKAEIFALLGTPDAVRQGGHLNFKAVPCEALGDWVYLFFHLPVHMLGNGPVLNVEFTTKGNCTRAWWGQ